MSAGGVLEVVRLLEGLADVLVDAAQVQPRQAAGVRRGAAAAQVEELKDSDAPWPMVDYLLARVAMGRADWQEALKLLERARPQLTAAWGAQVHALLAQCHHNLGDHDKAVSQYLRAVELGDRQPGHLIQAAALLVRSQRRQVLA